MTAHFTYSVRIYWEDTDAGGVVYYANYLKFMERARTEWLRSLGFGQDVLRELEGLVFVVRRVEIDYLAPARLDNLLTLDTQLLDVTRTTLTVAQNIAADKPLVKARVQLACVDAVSFKPARIPATLLEKLPPP
ncbi:MAG: tol-pal system-associated acyl-CoA thioesterase [Thiobacillaceae bacterium]